MFSHQTILSLQLCPTSGPSVRPSLGHFRDVHSVRNVMEAKQFLLRCVRGMQALRHTTPDVVLIDAGENSSEIKAELERWMRDHPRLERVRVKFPATTPWLLRWWQKWGQRKGAKALTV